MTERYRRQRSSPKKIVKLVIISAIMIFLPVKTVSDLMIQPASAQHVKSVIILDTKYKINEVAADSSDVYIVGTVNNQTASPSHTDVFVSKYDHDGNEIWTRQFGTASNDLASGIATYGQDIYAVGFAEYAFLTKYDNDGNIDWTIDLPPPPTIGGRIAIQSVIVDSSGLYVGGNVYDLFSGQTTPPAAPGVQNAFIRHYDLDGNEQWTRQFASFYCCPDESEPLPIMVTGAGMALDSDGVYMAGGVGIDGTIPGAEVTPSDSVSDGFVTKYSKEGDLQWTRQFGYGGRDWVAYDVAVYGDLVSVVGGLSFGPGNIRSFDTDGNFAWHGRFGALNLAVAADPSGIHIGGSYADYDGPRIDGTLGKFNSDGKILWDRYFRSDKLDVVKDIAIGGQSAFIVGTIGSGDLVGQSGPGGDFLMAVETDNPSDRIDFDGDRYEDLAIGVPGEDLNNSTKVDAGVVNVIYGSSSGLSATSGVADQRWSQDSPDIEAGPEQGDRFGAALAAGDFNNDGYSDLAIGVPDEDVGSVIDAGAVNVIYGSASGLSAIASNPDQFWTQDSVGIQDTSEQGDNFGYSMHVGDFNFDKYDDLVIGVPMEDVGSAIDAGGFHLVYGSATGLSTDGSLAAQFWEQDTPGVQDMSETDDYFGWSFTSADFNDDGFDDLAIGSYGEDNSPLVDDGAVHVIHGSFTGISTEDQETAMYSSRTFDPQSNENGVGLGYSLAVGDMSNSGYSFLIMGMPFADVGSNVDAGKIIVAYYPWTQNSPHVEGGTEAGDHFGLSLLVGNFNGDRFDDLAIGVPKESVGVKLEAGAVNVIYGSFNGLSATRLVFGVEYTSGRDDQSWSQDVTDIHDSSEAADNFGFSLAEGDFNNDGMDDLAVGVPLEDLGGAQDVGATNVIYGSSRGLSATIVRADQFWSQNSANIEDFGEKGDQFAWALSN